MANFTDAYRNGYLYLVNVFTGTYTPKNRTVSAATAVKYRKVSTIFKNVAYVANLGIGQKAQQLEMWASTLNGAIPQAGDQFTDKDGANWNAAQVDASDLTDSDGSPITWLVLVQKSSP